MNKLSWKTFELVEQKYRSYSKGAALSATSEDLNIPVKEVKAIMAAIKEEHPDLFFVDTERGHLSNKISGQERKKRNIQMVSYDARTKDGEHMPDEEIREKF